MRRSPLKPIVVDDLRGGRNGSDPPFGLLANQATEMLNVDWKDTTFARKRGGAASVSLTGGTGWTDGIYFLFRHVAGAVESAAELWGLGITGAAAFLYRRLTGGTTWADVSADDAPSTTFDNSNQFTAASLNGKLFLTYVSSGDRLHVYDPNLASPRIRRVGINPGSTAPTAADQVAGPPNMAATLRYYRVRFTQISGSTLIRRSEPTPSVSITPSGVNRYVRVTRPTAPGEGETHWEVEGSTDNVTFFQLVGFEEGGSVAIAGTAHDTDVAATDFPSKRVSEIAGTYALPPSARFLLTDGNRLLMAGTNSSGALTSTIYYTPVLGSSDKGDDERVPNTVHQKNRLALNERDGGAITGMGGPLDGIIYVFKARQVWRLVPTGDVAEPYLPRKIRDDIGCVSYRSICIGDDEVGRPALYFYSHRGPYRVTSDGVVQYLGRDNEDVWRAVSLTENTVPAKALYYPDLHQVWIWVVTSPLVKMAFDVQLGVPDQNGHVRGGWAKHTGLSATANACCLFANTLGASMSLDLKPYTAPSTSTIIKCDTTDTDDAGTDFQATVTSRPLLLAADTLMKVGCGEPTVIGKATAGSDVTIFLARDFGKETRQQTISLAPAGSETRIIKKVDDLTVGEADAIQVTVGDVAANDEVWSMDAVIVPIYPQEPR